MPEPVEFDGDQTSVLASGPSQVLNRFDGMSIVWRELICVDSGTPCLIAAARTKTLNVEPAGKPPESPYCGGVT